MAKKLAHHLGDRNCQSAEPARSSGIQAGRHAQRSAGCTAYWLEQAKSLHQTQLLEAETFTGDMMRKLMGSIDSAYDCATRSHL